MLLTSSGTFYSKVQFKTEEEVEKLVAVMSRETKNKITELCIAEIGKQKEFSKLLESDLKIQLIHVHGFVQKILEKDPIVSLPIDYSPSDLEEWASMQKVEVQIQHRKIYERQGRGALRLPGFGIDAGKGVLEDDGQEQRFVRDCEGGAFERGRCRAFRLRPEGQIQDALRRKNLFRRNRGGWNRFFGQRLCLALHSANQSIAHNDERLGHLENRRRKVPRRKVERPA